MTMRSIIHAVPLELLLTIISYLGLDDFCNLVQASDTLKIVLGSESTCREIVKRCIPQSAEARRAQSGQISYRRAITNAFRRRKAYKSARPFSAMVLGEGSDFLYRQGVLTYLRDGILHVVNVHEASGTELVIDMRSALKITSGGEHRFKLMHYQDNVLTVLHTLRSSNSDGYLVVFDTTSVTVSDYQRTLLHSRVPISQKQFVRHDSTTLIYGTYIGTEDSEDDTWTFWAFSIVRGATGLKTFSSRGLQFSTADVGSNILFEVYNGYFYVVTSQITVDAEGQDPTSYYGGCRYPLSDDISQTVEYWRIWRRQQREGPINDLWTDFDMQEDENGHGLVINESRREWQDGFSQQKRTFYTEPLDFALDSNFSASFKEFIEMKKIAARPSAIAPTDEDNTIESLIAEASKFTRPEAPELHRRILKYCQPEYCGPTGFNNREFTLASTKYRTYNYSNSTFLDIVLDNQQPTQCPNLQKHIRLRMGSRRLASPLDEDGLIRKLPAGADTASSADHEFHTDDGIQLWPPLDAPAELFQLLNQDPSCSKLKAASDERSVVYMPTSSDPKRIAPIVLINFDQAIRHHNLRKLDLKPGKVIAGTRSDSYIAPSVAMPQPGSTFRRRSPSQYTAGLQNRGDTQAWARIERAAWVDMAMGFRFS